MKKNVWKIWEIFIQWQKNVYFRWYFCFESYFHISDSGTRDDYRVARLSEKPGPHKIETNIAIYIIQLKFEIWNIKLNKIHVIFLCTPFFRKKNIFATIALNSWFFKKVIVLKK